MVGDHSRQMETQICTGRGRRRWISLITNPLNCWAPVPLSQINMAPLENTSENLGQTSGDYPIYYIHTEKYSPKSCVVNFDTQMSSSQSEEWTMVFTREKNDTSNQNRERCFFTCEKNDTSNQKPQMCVSFAPKFPPFLAACWEQLRTHSRRKVFL